MDATIEKRKTEQIVRRKRSEMYQVYIHNDNTTEYTFVVAVLNSIFDKNLKESLTLTETAQRDGKALVGVYPKKLAYAKKNLAMNSAQEVGFTDFKVTVQSTERR